MPTYYVNTNAQPNGDHEVHKTVGCSNPADEENRHYLGDFPSCNGAVLAAKQIYPTADGCEKCSLECHTR